MTKEAKLKSLETYVSERLDLHNDWYGKSNIKKMFEELETELKELKIKASSKSMAHICMQDDADRYYIELKEYRKLKSAVHKDIEKVWMYDSSYGLDDNQTIDRDACIEAVFYKIGNQWID